MASVQLHVNALSEEEVKRPTALLLRVIPVPMARELHFPEHHTTSFCFDQLEAGIEFEEITALFFNFKRDGLIIKSRLQRNYEIA